MEPDSLPAGAVVLQPGDRVLVALTRDDCPADSVHDMTDRLPGRFPDVDFTIVTGVQALAVQRNRDGQTAGSEPT